MTTPPTLNDREEDDLFDELVDRADVYTNDWDPHTPDTGRTILRIFSTFEADVRNRLNSVPRKQRIAFLDALGFDRRPPKAARVPLSFHVSGDLDRNVVIPGGTQAVAGTGESSQLFEIPRDNGFEATGASLTDVITVDPEEDAIVDHSSVLTDEDSAELFVGESCQHHHLYVANEDALNLQPGSRLSISAHVDIDTDAFADAVVWEYYGEDDDGDEDWHPLVLPRTGASTATTDSGIEAVREQLEDRRTSDDGLLADVQSASGTGSKRVTDAETAYEATFEVPGTIRKRSVNGIESRWLRCRLIGEERDLFTASIRDLSIHVGSTGDEGSLDPDLLLSNDVPLSTDEGDITPLGQLPQPPASFYIACEEAFTKSGGTIAIEFYPPETTGATETGSTEPSDTDEVDPTSGTSGGTPAVGVIGGEPRLSWEYWNGDGWTQLESVEDETNSFHDPGSVTFTVPDDIDQTTVSGHENVWIRARLVSGNYGQPSITVPDIDGFDGSSGFDSEPDPPVFSDVSIHYEHRDQSFDTVFRHNNASYSDDLSERTEAYTPFKDVPEDDQTIYLGFDDALHDGPLMLFVSIEDATYPQSFDPGMEWEYCTDSAEFSWTELDVQDRTGGFTERGIVTVTFPEATTAFDLFGRTRHWIRIRTTQDEFERPATAHRSRGETTVVDESSRTTAPPVVEGLYLNTRWAYNKRTIEDEILGSSEGSHDQSFRCAHAPMMTIEVWVNEMATLSANERRTLLRERSDDTEQVFDDRGDLSEFWVRWTEVDDFLDSTPSDRHYVVNKTLGTIQFGDGNNGAIPPAGQDNVRATYTTGGGHDGNVDAGTVSDLKSSISLVDDVSNPESADGGADVESIDALVSRSANRLKHRGKAVTPSDYEQVALSAFRELSTVKCETTSEDNGTRITVIIVPETERDKPVPSMTLKHDVRDTLTDRAPATVVESDDVDIVVRGPGYAEVSVQATIRAPNVKSVSLLKQRIRRELDAFLHPLTGKDGIGWSFGEVPDTATLVARLNDRDEVTETVQATVYVDVNGERQALIGQSTDEVFPRNTLVCSGEHTLSITMDTE